MRRRDDRDRAAHAESGDADLGAVRFRYCAAPRTVCERRVHEVERRHLLRGRLGVVVGHDDALVEVGRERIEAGQRETVDDRLDLLRQTPPFLDHHQPGRVPAARIGQIALRVAAVRTLERDCRPHFRSCEASNRRLRRSLRAARVQELPSGLRLHQGDPKADWRERRLRKKDFTITRDWLKRSAFRRLSRAGSRWSSA